MSFAEKVGLVLMAFESTANISANATDSNLHQLAPLKFNGSSLTVLSSLLTSVLSAESPIATCSTAVVVM